MCSKGPKLSRCGGGGGAAAVADNNFIEHQLHATRANSIVNQLSTLPMQTLQQLYNNTILAYQNGGLQLSLCQQLGPLAAKLAAYSLPSSTNFPSVSRPDLLKLIQTPIQPNFSASEPSTSGGNGYENKFLLNEPFGGTFGLTVMDTSTTSSGTS